MSKKFDFKDKVKTKEDKEFYDKYMKMINDVKGNKNLSKEKKLESFFWTIKQMGRWRRKLIRKRAVGTVDYSTLQTIWLVIILHKTRQIILTTV